MRFNSGELLQTQRLGNVLLDVQRKPFSLYDQELNKQVNAQFWKSYAQQSELNASVQNRGLLPMLDLVPNVDRIFGGSGLNIKPNGSFLLDVGYSSQFIDNPALPVQLRRINNLYFNEQAQINFQGKIGDKMNVNTNFDTKASFNFQNQLKLNWKTQEEDILQSIEAGNTSWVLNSQLIPGVQNLFGLKSLLRFGNLDVTVVAAQQRSKQDCITLRGGTQGRNFEFRADQYDENRHFFLAPFFRENYERNLKNLPMVNSGIMVTRVEVYVTNRTQNTETLRNLVGLFELGDNLSNDKEPADNPNNQLFRNIVASSAYRSSNTIGDQLESTFNLSRGLEFDVLKGARKLNEREFKFHPQLGYISLVAPIRNDEMLAVAFEYTFNGRKYKVGELMEDYAAARDDQVIYLKLLKAANLRNRLSEPKGKKQWDLMMKNIYSLNSGSLSRQNFQLKIVYKDDASGIDNSNAIEAQGPYQNQPFVKALGFDQLNYAGDRQFDGGGLPIGDGNYDFVEDLTVDTKNGRIIFTKLEPFSSKNLNPIFGPKTSKYQFDDLYRKTQTDAIQSTTQNKFFLKGAYQGGMGGTDINLPFGVEPRSVMVSAGGQPLSPGTDFIVEGQSGRVKIINEGVFNSGRELKVCYEKPDLFTNQVRTLLGTRLDYNLGKNLHLGATLQRMRETPPAFFRRVAMGNEPVNNTLWGLDASFYKKSNGLTRLLDKLPFVSTKESSVIDFQGEMAQLIPAVNQRVQGNAFIDDFEGVRMVYNLGAQPTAWKPGSTPRDFLPAGVAKTSKSSNDRRARISAYTIDASVYGLGNFSLNTPGIDPGQINANAYERAINPRSLYPQKDFPNNINNLPIGTLDIAYFPSERGIYNFNTNLDPNGLLPNPKQNFGSIVRPILSDTDFDNSNVEILEFWMMDPFLSGEAGKVKDGIFNRNNEKGGKIKFHLGDVSEDFIPDGYYNFENGIPSGVKDTLSTSPQRNVETTPWGLAPRRQFVINAFDNQGGRAQQDLGLDGIPSQSDETNPLSEQSQHASYLNALQTRLNPNAFQTIKSDPAGDDFRFYLNEQFGNNAGMVERYKYFMGMEKNSPSNQNQSNTNSFTQASSIQPDREDINNDNTVNEQEAYFEYEMDLRKGQLANHPYVVDKINDGSADWYLVRIPIKDKNAIKAKVGNVENFKSVRFVRLVTTDFEEPVVLRLSQFQLSGYSYRRFAGNIDQKGGFNLDALPSTGSEFKVATVNIEENGSAKGNAIPYVVPPGFVRDQDITTINNARLNEQALSLSIRNMAPGEAQGAFRNTTLDFINYQRIKMLVSLQDLASSNYSEDLSKAGVFLRLGTDLTDHYYEIRKNQLTKTTRKAGIYSDVDVWPLENEFDVDLEWLKQVKLERDKAGKSLSERFSLPSPDGQYTITVMGRPDLSTVLSIMVGIRNLSTQPLSFQVWVNELRSHGFNQQTGTAALGKMAIKLADLGNVTMSGSFKNFGFGGVQTKISERNRDNFLEYSIASNLSLDRFFPKSWNLRIPFFISWDIRNIAPNFDPLDPDIRLENSLNKFNSSEARAFYERLVVDHSERFSYNFSNVKKLRSSTKKTSYPWDISNFAWSYSFSSARRSNTLMDGYLMNQYRGSMLYAFSNSWRDVKPFNWIKGSSQFSTFVKDFTFNLMPSSITVRMEMDRSFSKTQMRNEELSILGVLPQFEKYWYFNRQYALTWNLTKSILLNYNAQANAIIDEPYGDMNTQAAKDSVWKNIRNFGRPKMFDQTAGFVYRLPLNKLSLTDWMSADYSHKVGYNYLANSFNLKDDNGDLFGDIIKNSRDRSINGKVDFVALYNRIRALRWANSPKAEGKDVATNPGDEEEVGIPQKTAIKSITRLLMTLRGIQVNYTISESTTLPGFNQAPGILGQNAKSLAPGYDFIFGGQSDGIRFKAAENGWLSPSIQQNIPFTQIRQKKLAYSTQLEPSNNLRIQIDGNYNRGDNYQEFFRPNQVGGPFLSQSPIRSGNYSMTFLSFLTAFDPADGVFERFRSNRKVLLDRLNATYRSNIQGEGGAYDLNSQDVLIPSFFAAYAGVDAKKVKYSPFYNIPLPNWRAEFNGINLLPWLKNNFTSFSITHQYQSTYSVGNFVSSLEYGKFYDDYLNLTLNSLLYPLASRFEKREINGVSVNALIPVYVMSTITFQEKFSPLVGFNAITKSKISLRFEYAQDRNVGLNLANSQVAELSNKDLTFAVGFTKSNTLLPISINGKQVKLPNDLRFNMNLTLRDTRTLQRKLDAETVVTQGFINFQFRPQLSYNVNNRLSVMVYYDKMFNNPLVSNSFYRSNAQGGFQIRYSLTE